MPSGGLGNLAGNGAHRRCTAPGRVIRGIETRSFGEFRRDVPPELLRDLVYGGIEHHAWNYFQGRGRLDVEAVTNSIMSVLRDGIVAKTRKAA